MQLRQRSRTGREVHDVGHRHITQKGMAACSGALRLLGADATSRERYPTGSCTTSTIDTWG